MSLLHLTSERLADMCVDSYKRGRIDAVDGAIETYDMLVAAGADPGSTREFLVTQLEWLTKDAQP